MLIQLFSAVEKEMRKVPTKMISLISGVSICIAQSLQAGGLADAIVEESPVEIGAVQATNATPGWVLPAVGLLLLGVAISSSGGGGGSSSDSDDSGSGLPPPSSGGVK